MASATIDTPNQGRFRPPVLLGLLVAFAIGAGMATFFWTTGLVNGAYIAGLQDEFDTAQTGPGVAVATLVAFGIGASMVVLPCGFPAVFMVPSILERSENTAGRLRSLTAFAVGGVAPLAVAGLGLGLAGSGILGLLTSPQSRMWFAAVTYTTLGAGVLVYALSESRLIHVRTPFEHVTGPSLAGTDAPARRSFVLGATFGGGLGIACPMPTYYALLGWVVVAATGWYGALVLGAYGLGRMIVPIVLGLLIVGGASRRVIAERMAAAHGRVQWASSVTMAALGAFMVTLFGGFLGRSLL